MATIDEMLPADTWYTGPQMPSDWATIDPPAPVMNWMRAEGRAEYSDDPERLFACRVRTSLIGPSDEPSITAHRSAFNKSESRPESRQASMAAAKN